MIPISLDPSNVDLGVVGRGPLLMRRLQQLQSLGADPFVYCDIPGEDVIEAAKGRLVRRMPSARDLRDLQVVWIAGLDEREAAPIASAARAEKTLVNAEDMLPFCDFHQPAIVQRGDLVLAASTGGASPAAAKLARETLEAAFPTSWAEALAEAREVRRHARNAGILAPEIMARTKEILFKRGLLPPVAGA